MKMLNILTTIWTEPWLLMPEVHRQLCSILEAHITGEAHQAGGIADALPAQPETPSFSTVGQLAVIPIQGVLGKHVGDMAKSSGATDIGDIENALDECMADPEIKGILLDVNSPGGTTTGIPELASKIAQATIHKPIVAYTDSRMASAAYWLASGADAIFASQSASIGSIGVYMAWLDDSRAMEMRGYRAELIKRGKFKAVGISGTALSAEARSMLQQNVDQVYDWFTSHVKMFREDIPDSAMEGQVFFGQSALDNDLTDRVGTLDDALAELADMADIK